MICYVFILGLVLFIVSGDFVNVCDVADISEVLDRRVVLDLCFF